MDLTCNQRAASSEGRPCSWSVKYIALDSTSIVLNAHFTHGNRISGPIEDVAEAHRFVGLKDATLRCLITRKTTVSGATIATNGVSVAFAIVRLACTIECRWIARTTEIADLRCPWSISRSIRAGVIAKSWIGS